MGGNDAVQASAQVRRRLAELELDMDRQQGWVRGGTKAEVGPPLAMLKAALLPPHVLLMTRSAGSHLVSGWHAQAPVSEHMHNLLGYSMGVLPLPMQLACWYGLCPSQVTEVQCQDLLFSNADKVGLHCKGVEECTREKDRSAVPPAGVNASDGREHGAFVRHSP